MADNTSILITRPLPDAYSTQHYLQHVGFSCVIEPLLTLRYETLDPKQFIPASNAPIQALIITSRNDVRALHHLMPHCQLPLITIGEKTAQLAKELGFQVIHSASGDSTHLTSLIRHHYNPAAGKLLYLSGDKTAKDNYLENTLTSLHYQCQRIPVYRMEPQNSFTPSLIHAFHTQKISAVTFFSPRTVEIFMHLARQHQLLPFLHFIPAFCLSAEISACIKSGYFAALHTSSTPTNTSLCDLVGKYLRT